ncbi:MAG: hypothetical protein Q9164_002380 [Protoblastenia rupestris]
MEETQPLTRSPPSRNTTSTKPLPPLESSYEQKSPSARKVAAPMPEQQKLVREQKPPRKLMNCARYVLEVTWLPEFTSLILAIIALVATVILLVSRRDKPQPDWPSLLNINALIAIFSTILKAALLFSVSECISELKWIWFAAPQPVSDFDRFDSASRGPWGAFLLLLKRPKSIATALGSLITILSLTTDPLAQQALRFTNCLLPVEGSSATIARTNNYTVGAFGLAVGQPLVSVAMSAALYQGLLDPPPNASTVISTYCQSGNCTFPHANDTAYTSLAMCSTVEDISRTISGNGSDDENLQYETYNYTLPSGLFLPGTKVLTTSVISSGSEEASKPLLSIEALMVNSNCSGPASQSQGNCTATPFAIRATLSPCIHTYTNVSYSNAIFSETIASTTKVPFVSDLGYFTLAGAYPALPSIDCTPSSSRGGYRTEAANTLPNGVRYHNDPSVVANDANTLYYDRSCIYDFSYGPTTGLETAFRQIFFGTIASTSTVSIPRGLTSQPIGDAWMLPLYAGGRANISSTERYFQGLATSMTAAIRDNGDVIGSEPARGTVIASQTCVGVNWAWLALPIVLLVFTAGFLVITVLMSSRFRRVGGREGKRGKEAGRRAWKSSSLPLLWCGIGDKIRDKYDGFDEVEKMKKTGDGFKVRLERQGGQEGGHSKPLRDGKSRWMLKEY